MLQIYHSFVHPSLNCEDLHAELAWADEFIPRECLEREVRIVAKASFGFGDVNSCLILSKYSD